MSQRRILLCVLRPCVTGCRDDEAVRGCLSHHHPLCSLTPLALPLLFALILWAVTNPCDLSY